MSPTSARRPRCSTRPPTSWPRCAGCSQATEDMVRLRRDRLTESRSAGRRRLPARQRGRERTSRTRDEAATSPDEAPGDRATRRGDRWPGSKAINVTQWMRNISGCRSSPQPPNVICEATASRSRTTDSRSISIAWIHDIKPFDQDASSGRLDPRLNIPWFGFATWATATLNADIRNDDPPYRSDRLMPLGFRRRLHADRARHQGGERPALQPAAHVVPAVVFINTTFTYSAMRSEAGPQGRACVWAEINDAGDIIVTPWNGWMDEARGADASRAGETSGSTSHRHFEPVADGIRVLPAGAARSVVPEELSPRTKRRSDDRTATRVLFRTPPGAVDLLRQPDHHFGRAGLVNPGVERVLNNVPTAANDFLERTTSPLSRSACSAYRASLPVFGSPSSCSRPRPASRDLGPAPDPRAARAGAADGDPSARPRHSARRRGRAVLPAGTLRPTRAARHSRPSGSPHRRRLGRPARVRRTTSNSTVSTTSTCSRRCMAFDRSHGEGFGTGARDWRRIVERMNWATTHAPHPDPGGAPVLAAVPERGRRAHHEGSPPLHPGNPTDFDVLGPLEGFAYLSGGGSAAFGQGGSQ